MKFSRENHLVSDENADSVAKSPDLFDQLPDDILLEIFNRVLEAKSLVQCLTVSRRFKTLIPQIESIHLQLPRHIARAPSSKPAKLFKNLLRFLQNAFVSGSKNDKQRNVLYHSPIEVLKGFKELKSLRLELPSCKGEIGLSGKDSLLKWKAGFGSGLRSCVILGANSARKTTGIENDGRVKENDNNRTPLADEDLKTRIVWMISSLIAASARHYLTRRVVSSLPTLENVVVSDGDRRGRVSMRGDELSELRSESSDVAVESSLERSLIPDLGMKLWHVPRMVLPRCGWVLEGATLVVIRPLQCGAGEDGSDGGDESELLSGAGFDGDEAEREVFGEAIKEILKTKKNYAMEMTSF